jgi:hypothetical protein
MLEKYLNTLSSPSAFHASLQTSTLQVSNRTTGAAVSLNKKADVRNYLFARRRKNVLPFRSMSQPDATGYSESEADRARVKAPGAGSRPDGSAAPSIVEKR